MGGYWFARIFELLNYIIYSNHIPADIQIGENTSFEHHGLGCVVHSKVTIGANCKIFQNVTIGAKWPEGSKIDGVPQIGNITIGDNVYIGANAVVLKDVPDNSIAIGVPAEIKARRVASN